MTAKDPFSIIRHPQLSEKANDLSKKQNTYVFVVDSNATKRDIKQAIQTLYKVKVADVRTAVFKGKIKRARNMVHSGQRRDWKKAFVKLAEGSRLDII